jgi:hypothetical protein
MRPAMAQSAHDGRAVAPGADQVGAEDAPKQREDHLELRPRQIGGHSPQ